ncbi:hypothetical protein [Alteraurantiacibacter buctensis]|uniref:hypothetical protein n=1 Tax=Alteraurantiacibacter buctensis TaxID=1503981 RepID=UPI001F1BACCA|nr:hypothetical protein [Alteraurantiacibacter buctensis]
MKPDVPKQPPARPLLAWLSVALAGIAVPAVALLLQVDAPAPAPLALVGGPILAVGLMGTAMIAAAIGGRLWAGALLALLTGVGLIYLAKALGMPPLPHPFSTGLAVIVTSFGFAAMGKFLARVSSARAWMTAAGLTAGQALVLLIAAAAPGLFPDWLLALVPAQWASVSIQTALTGTGTRAASSALITLSGSAVVLLLAAWLRRRPGWCVPVLLAAWIALAALVWTRPAPPMPRADLAIVAAPAGPVAPIADVPPNPATASAIDRVRRQIDKWSAAAETDPAQRARNLLLIAAVPDLYDTEPLQSHLPVLVAAELEARLPAGQRAAILAAIAADPAAGSVAARETLPELGLPANVGDEAPVRNRMALYAARLNR